jgi:hypothetical protein
MPVAPPAPSRASLAFLPDPEQPAALARHTTPATNAALGTPWRRGARPQSRRLGKAG